MVWDGHMTQFWPLGSEEKSTGAETLGKVFPCSVREDTRQKRPLLLWLVIVLSTGETQIVATCLWPWWRLIWGQNKQAKDSRTENNWSSMVSLSLRMSQLWSYPLLEFALCEIIKYPHCLNHLKLSFLLGAAKSNIMITKKQLFCKNVRIPHRFCGYAGRLSCPSAPCSLFHSSLTLGRSEAQSCLVSMSTPCTPFSTERLCSLSPWARYLTMPCRRDT